MSDNLRFTISTAGEITQVTKLKSNGRTEIDRIEANETYTYALVADVGEVTYRETNAGFVEQKIYRDSGDGVYVRVSEVYFAPDGTPLAAGFDDNGNDEDEDEDDDGYDDDLDGDGNDDDEFEGDDDDDVAFGSAGDDSLSGGDGDDYLHGGIGDDSLVGDDGDDLLEGSDGDDSVMGGGGDDAIIGGSGLGDDVYNGGDGDDSVIYSSAVRSVKVELDKGRASGKDIGKDTLSAIENIVGGAGDDSLTGNAQANSIEGGAGKDAIKAGDGDDTLVGGLGRDALTGGNGADVFVFTSTADSATKSSRDKITDFRTGDKIDLSGIDADTGTSGRQAFDGLFTSLSSGDAGRLVFSKGVLLGDVNGDGVADFQVELAGVRSLALSDLILTSEVPV